jgi:Uma2 family endonuclease
MAYACRAAAEPEASGEPRPFLAAANVGLFPSIQAPPLVPDVFLSLDVRVHQNWYDKNHRTYFFWEFGKAPEVVIEIVSSRKSNEKSRKLHDYARIGVSYYAIYDPTRQPGRRLLQVYELRGRKYHPRADYKLPDVGLSLTLWVRRSSGYVAALV